MNTGWHFYASHAGRLVEIFFTTTGNYSFDLTRDVPRSLTGLMMIPSEVAKVDLSADEIQVYLNIDGTATQFGVFRFSEVNHQKGVVRLSDTTAGDLTNVSLNDRLVELKRNDGSAHSLAIGADPAQAMQKILSDAGIPSAITGSTSPLASAVTWDGSTEDLTRLTNLATLAGHRPPWSNNAGVVRSVLANVIQADIIDLLDLRPTAGTIVITDNYLTAPNRIIVTDTGSALNPISGQWDAPASAPNSAARRGYVQTQMVEQQGLFGNAHADEVAATLGEQLLARQLDAEILLTTQLDGPAILSYDDSTWLLQSWSTSTAPGATMKLTATELIISD